jgi:PAS domain S-box-containing protein
VADAVRARSQGRRSQALSFLPGALDHVADGIVVLDHDRRCGYVNEPAGAILGRRAAQMVGRQIWSLLPEGIAGRSAWPATR